MQVNEIDLETVKNFYKGWELKDQNLLKLSDDFVHNSSFGIYHSREEFLKKCWKYSGIKLFGKIFSISENIVTVNYSIINEGNECKFTEKVFVNGGVINRIEVESETI